LLSPGFLGTATADESAKNAVGLNFDISFEEMVWSETESGEFNLFLDYTIGANATGMSIGLYQSGCVTNYTSDDPIISDITVPVDNKDVDKNIYVDKRLLSVNNTELVTHDKSKGLSKGSLDFCIKAETWVGDTSAAFHKQNLKLTFDLSVNSFEVLDNDITTGVVPRPNPDPIVSTFKSAQCVCDGTQDTYGTPDSCDFGDDSYMNAKFLSFAKTDVFGVSPIILGDVFTFTRTFNPNADVKYTPVTIGKDGRPKPDTLSLIQKEYPSYRVVSRLITALFDGGATKFDVAGNAYLEFKQNRRLHGRSLQDTPARAGESFFQMEVQFKKGVAPANDVTLTDSKSGWVLTSVGALIALSAAFLILKKMKK